MVCASVGLLSPTGWTRRLRLSSHAAGLSFGLELPIVIDGVGGVPPPPTFTFHQARASLIVERL
jgi:hypothetical protein